MNPDDAPLQPVPVHHSIPEGRRAVAMGLTTATMLILQVALTRVASVVVWYHWAFLAVSLALLGVAAPGVWFALIPRREGWLSRFLLLAGALVPAAVALVVHSGALAGTGGAPWVCLIAALSAFLALGGATCLLLLSAPGPEVGRLYAADLLGAALGAALTLPLLGLGPTPRVAAALGVLPLVAHAVLWPRRVVVPAVIAVVSMAGVGWGAPFGVRYTKTYVEAGPERTPIYERWSPSVRVTVFDNVFWMEEGGGFTWGGGESPKSGMPRNREQYWLEQDGSAGTPIPRFDGDWAELDYLFTDVTSVAYGAARPRRVAVVGAGGGRDVLTALAAGATHVDAIELHAVILDTVRHRFGDFSGHLYDDPRVTPIVGEGRHVLSRADHQYDLIQLSLIDSWTATAAGAYTLSENHLYTIEAYRLYWSRLSPTGLVTTSRWMRGSFGLELPRLVVLAHATLTQEAVPNPELHLAVVRGGAVGTVIVSRQPIVGQLAQRLADTANERGFALYWPPAIANTQDPGLTELIAEGPHRYAREGIDLSPPTDDRPFFFQVLSPFGKVSRPVARSYGVNNEGVWTLRLVMLVTSVVAAALVLLPFLFTSQFERRGLWRGSAYFVCIGLGFMLVEVTWLQKLVLVLGHPSRAATLVLGALLLGCGLGSWMAARWGLAALQRWGWVTALLIVGGTLLAGMAGTLLGVAWVLRAVVAAVVIAGCGMVMGVWFPLGIQRFGDANKAWFWGVNGAASVVAGVCALGLAMSLGYTRVALVGSVFYAAAWGLVRGRLNEAPQLGGSL